MGMTPEADLPIMLYTTFPTGDAAEEVGRALVEKKLAACVNILPAMISLYEWEGKIERAHEAVMLIKTHKSRQKAVIEETLRWHPYETPAVLAIDVTDGNHDYFQWIAQQTAGAGKA